MDDGNLWLGILSLVISAGSLLYAKRSHSASKEANELAREANDLVRSSAEKIAFTVSPSEEDSQCIITNSGSVVIFLDSILFREYRTTWEDSFGVFQLNPNESKSRFISSDEWNVSAGQEVTITYHRDQKNWHKKEKWNGVVQSMSVR